MNRSGPPIHYHWPLHERPLHFELGSMLDCASVELRRCGSDGRSGWWECDLSDDRLSWSGGVFDIFGLPRDAAVTRQEALQFYAEPSRVILERLRSASIRDHLGFTLDAELRPASGEASRWMRIIGAPDIANGKVVGLHGLKLWL